MEMPISQSPPALPNPYIEHLGVTREETRTDYARLSKTVEAEDTDTSGLAHNGLYFSLADEVCGSILDAREVPSVTINASCHFLQGARPGDRITAEAREVKSGRTLSFFDVQITNQDGVLLGNGTFTFFRLDKKIEL